MKKETTTASMATPSISVRNSSGLNSGTNDKKMVKGIDQKKNAIVTETRGAKDHIITKKPKKKKRKELYSQQVQSKGQLSLLRVKSMRIRLVRLAQASFFI